jgi:P-type Mg2+ transporter
VAGASDIAKEASDIVLLKKSLKVITEGIKEGRDVFANTNKYILATLSANFGNFFAVATASFIISYLPMLPLQILLVNLLSDFPMIAVATDTVDDADVMTPRRYNLKEFAALSLILGSVSTIFDFIFFSTFFHSQPAVLQTSWFMGSVITELVFIYSIRSRRFFLFSKKPSWSLLGLTGVAAAVTLLIPLTSFGHNLFKFQSYSIHQISTIGLIIAGYFTATEMVKLLYYKFSK